MFKFIFLFVIVKLTIGYNLNTLHTIIYEDAHKNLRIDARESLFGYTTALYRSKNKSWVFIGSPKGTDLNMPSSNPGVVFQCQIRKYCEMQSIDKDFGMTRSNGFRFLDNKDNAWIGGTMDININAGVLVVCGFRWAADMNMIGACYLAKLEDNPSYDKLLPLLNPKKYIQALQYRMSVYHYGLGEAGFSAHFTNDKQYPDLILGAPGLLNWFGGSILYSGISSSNSTENRVSMYMGDSFSLFGYAVSSGRYTSSHQMFASSAPKGSKYCGTVILYNFQPGNDSFIDKKFILSGSQIGEYFGASLASGDLNGDGYDDLIVGAPFYVDKNFNDGRIHIYYGGKERNSFTDANSVVHLTGSSDSGHYGTTVTFLGDLNLDGYGDIAVGEPFSDNKRGIVYIYHGGPYGLISTPAQILQAKNIDNKLRGFGISVSNALDIDGNGYPDISIGAHLSGHVAIIRSNPLVEISSSLKIINGTKINFGTTTIAHCYTHLASPYTPKHITIRRTLTIDENYQRVLLAPPTTLQKEFLLDNKCETFILTSKEKLYYLTEPVKISVSYEIVQEPPRKSNYYVGLNNTDTFCKTCPVLLNVRPLENEFSFALGCGDDDVCTSNLSFDAKFYILETEIREFIIGSADIIRMDVLISNSGDSAYLTQFTITLPKYIQFNSIPKKCSEDNPGILVCLVGNPLKTQMYLSVALNMKDVRIDYGSNVTFTMNVTTTSVNKNPVQQKSVILQLKNIVDLKLIGKAEPALQFYTKNATFRQIFEIQKSGYSPAEQVSILINLPTHVVENNVSIAFVKLYSIEGSLRGQKLLCKNHSEVEYIREESESQGDTDLNVEEDIQRPERERREISSENMIIYSNNLNESDYTEETSIVDENEIIEEEIGEILTLDCRDLKNNVQCTKFTCEIGAITNEQDIAVVRVKALLDITAIKRVLTVENRILLNSYGLVEAEFEIDTISNNFVNVTSTFMDSNEFRLDMWILISATIAGLILLLIVTLILYKCGFFSRTKKLQMEEEMRLAVAEEFTNARLSGAPPPDSDNELENDCMEAVEEMEMK